MAPSPLTGVCSKQEPSTAFANVSTLVLESFAANLSALVSVSFDVSMRECDGHQLHTHLSFEKCVLLCTATALYALQDRMLFTIATRTHSTPCIMRA